MSYMFVPFHIFVRPIFIIINTIINNFFYSLNYTYYYRLSFWSLWPSINNTQKSLNGSINNNNNNNIYLKSSIQTSSIDYVYKRLCNECLL